MYVNTLCGILECEEGALRLVDGNSPYDGGLEICQVGVWGTICDYLWDRTDSLVACRQLFGDNVTGSCCVFKVGF